MSEDDLDERCSAFGPGNDERYRADRIARGRSSAGCQLHCGERRLRHGIGPRTTRFIWQNGALTSSAVLLGRVVHSQNLAAGSTYNGSLSTAVPVAVGNYQIVVVADSGDVTADVNRTNNLAASATVFTATVPSLSLGGSVFRHAQPGPGPAVSDRRAGASASVGLNTTADAALSRELEVCRVTRALMLTISRESRARKG